MKIKSAMLAVVLLSGGCSQAPVALTELDRIPESYRMQVSQRCFCPQDMLGPFEIEVVGGEAKSAKRLSDGELLPLEYVGDEIPDLQLILQSLTAADTKRTHKREVRWIQEPYVPSFVHIDRSEMISDDEITYIVESFELID